MELDNYYMYIYIELKINCTLYIYHSKYQTYRIVKLTQLYQTYRPIRVAIKSNIPSNKGGYKLSQSLVFMDIPYINITFRL